MTISFTGQVYSVTSLFIKQLSEYEHFRDADKDSKEYKLWKVMTTERNTENETMIDPQGIEGVMPHYFKTIDGLSVGITSRFFVSAIRAGCCRLRQLVGN